MCIFLYCMLWHVPIFFASLKRNSKPKPRLKPSQQAFSDSLNKYKIHVNYNESYFFSFYFCFLLSFVFVAFSCIEATNVYFGIRSFIAWSTNLNNISIVRWTYVFFLRFYVSYSHSIHSPLELNLNFDRCMLTAAFIANHKKRTNEWTNEKKNHDKIDDDALGTQKMLYNRHSESIQHKALNAQNVIFNLQFPMFTTMKLQYLHASTWHWHSAIYNEYYCIEYYKCRIFACKINMKNTK